MTGFRVQVIGRKPIVEPISSLPTASYPLTPYPQQPMEDVDLNWPTFCPCCGAPTESHHFLIVNQSTQSGVTTLSALTTSIWKVPYCDRCLHHVTLMQQRPASSSLIEITTLILAVLVVAAVLPSSPLAAGLCFICIILAGIAAHTWSLRRYVKSIVQPAMLNTCVSPDPAITYEGWNSDRTKHTFIFRREDYAQNFCEINLEGRLIRVK